MTSKTLHENSERNLLNATSKINTLEKKMSQLKRTLLASERQVTNLKGQIKVLTEKLECAVKEQTSLKSTITTEGKNFVKVKNVLI